MKPIDRFYEEKEEPIKGCLMALKSIIKDYHPDIEPRWYYRLPCFMYKNQIFCYLWVDKKTQFPYIAIGKGIKLKHPDLIQGKRTFTKLLLIDPKQDIPIEKIYQIFDMAMEFYGDN
ncbi:DUF1801 domain-containing protein [Tenacibaculum sp. 190524A02b]|uniref:DUF1801 domain-containing protein n=1 Tax=Tenacibaculum vairaonense TaxID=3137860 RepID=UPI0031FA7E91